MDEKVQIESLKSKVNQMKRMYISLEQQMDDKDIEIEKLEEARDKFRDQALDLKQEIKWINKSKTTKRSHSRK